MNDQKYQEKLSESVDDIIAFRATVKDVVQFLEQQRNSAYIDLMDTLQNALSCTDHWERAKPTDG